MEAIFPKGNADSWNFAITNYLPQAVSVIMKTVDPIVNAALIALIGNSAEFERDTGMYQLVFDKDGLPTGIEVTLSYKVPSFQVPDATNEAVEKDRAFVLAYLQQGQGYKLKALELCTKRGLLSVAFSVKVGYSND